MMNQSANIDNRLWFLEEIHSRDLPLTQDLYRLYPGMKFGLLEHIDFFSARLTVKLLQILNDRDASLKNNWQNWIITAPAFYHLPAAANLLAKNIQCRLQQLGCDIRLIFPKLSQESNLVGDSRTFAMSNNYSKHSRELRYAHRLQNYRIHDEINLQAQFHQQHVIVINDIYVTGVQQMIMQQLFHRWQIASCNWLYIFKVEEHLAQQNPEIEHQLNTSQYRDLASYTELLNQKGLHLTRRCIAHLLEKDLNDFNYVITRLPPEILEKIQNNISKEWPEYRILFAEKLAAINALKHENNIGSCSDNNNDKDCAKQISTV